MIEVFGMLLTCTQLQTENRYCNRNLDDYELKQKEVLMRGETNVYIDCIPSTWRGKMALNEITERSKNDILRLVIANILQMPFDIA